MFRIVMALLFVVIFSLPSLAANLKTNQQEFSDNDACRIIARADVCGLDTTTADALVKKNRNETPEETYAARIGIYLGCYNVAIAVANHELKKAKFTCADVDAELQKLTAFLTKF